MSRLQEGVDRMTRIYGPSASGAGDGVRELIGRGSEFVLRLPALPAKPQATDVPSAEHDGALALAPQKRVLIVDDNPDVAESLTMVLELLGHQVRAVHDVHAAFPEAPIVGVGGVASGEDAVELLLAGARAVQVGTATFARPKAPAIVLRDLARWCQRHHVSTIDELIGAAHAR